MVSTRSVRYKFSEGERVLCYEPDPTKAKVLYDSKVLEVIESKDKRGKRSVEYLIHFQGWNSSWDRCVSEDFVLKDTEENRQLQRDLAEKSQLQLGAYLYRRERKKGSSNAGSVSTKRARLGFSDDGSSSSTQPDEGETAADTDTSSGSTSSAQPTSSPGPPHSCRAQIPLPPSLRDRLTLDYHLVVKRGRVARLPASPSAAEILESVVKWFGRAGAWNPPRGKHEPPQKPDILEVSARLNLVREVADGLRVYFDFIFRGHMLYKQEMAQYHEMCGQYNDFPTDINSEGEDQENQSPDEDPDDDEDVKSPRIAEYAHLPPDPEYDQDDEPLVRRDRQLQPDEIKKEIKEEQIEIKEEIIEPVAGPSHDVVVDEPQPAAVARRLRSHKSAVSQSENEEPAPSTSTAEPKPFETHSSSVGSSGSSTSEYRGARVHTYTPSTSTRTPLSLLMEKVAKFELIPREGTEHLPCRVYGAIHLARLFVILPVFLNATQMPDMKLKVILKYIDIFVQYLDEHSEWFGESFYVPNTFLQ
ncbi:protein male-specific lethal-3 isoform X2 [Colias croceus]|uniref:protein male-specific lethal-3 isoform X2 n=1 Tax=Colias crocea TaxID=72248 RepID=UPI001E27AC00|nr:protein male-specific lethal-3 isoform X2 [Colias croceus]